MSDAIWKCVYRCAQELTQQGVTPFTRGDLIRCVQRYKSDCGPGSINPIIQGLTENLRGGASGAVGKNLLHSVGRGQFVLRGAATSGSLEKKPSWTSVRSQPGAVREQDKRPTVISHETLEIGGYAFKHICDIEPVKNDDGTVREFTPQDRYENTGRLALNRYGVGPFCKFKISRNIARSGVYALVVDEYVYYIGECENLTNRFNMGYGNISPRNCFAGGQETNCRINNLIFTSVSEGLKATLWFHETSDYKQVESDLRARGKFGWNRT
ncbi:GIY-YIG nuclease family protein [Aidingimonas halophila]|uniref:DUF7669 domain-containing protein n=1 Tax=Aidingimonas halophila TaxID=574349 RepID=A0A1H2ZZ75_9GAMM|nr:GIY-YIG nuclease family protein [Aidingimonas halophila]GHC21217.1 hypothetical protein GCM10008094_09830 [Aidingimonas halophila]SDX22675.1 hypothetical protein SAMN05443545_104307 [Aidingimonas halophila]